MPHLGKRLTAADFPAMTAQLAGLIRFSHDKPGECRQYVDLSHVLYKNMQTTPSNISW